MSSSIKKVGRLFTFFWRSGTTNKLKMQDETAQHLLEVEVEVLQNRFPELRQATNIYINSTPHPTPKADGRIDPHHVNYMIADSNGKRITGAHVYDEPVGGRMVWMASPKYNEGKRVNDFYPINPNPNPGFGKTKDDDKEGK